MRSTAAAANSQHVNRTACACGVGTSRLQLHNRSNLESFWQINHAARSKAMGRIIRNRSKFITGEVVKRVPGPVAKGGRISVVSLAPRERVGSVNRETVVQAPAVRDVQAVVA